mgnify:CR=1 FL=1
MPRPAFSPVTAFRSALASVLLAALAVGGVALPAVHRATHGLEVAEARADHAATHHGDAGHDGDASDARGSDLDVVEAPCPPSPNEVDCAVCAGLSVAADLAVSAILPPEATLAAHEAHADRVRAVTAGGAGARAPPVS